SLDVSSLVCRERPPLRLTQTELEQHPAWRELGSGGGPPPPLGDLLAVPLTDREGHHIGVVQLSDRLEGDFTEDDQALPTALAGLTATAFRNARLFAASQRELAERRHGTGGTRRPGDRERPALPPGARGGAGARPHDRYRHPRPEEPADGDQGLRPDHAP